MVLPCCSFRLLGVVCVVTVFVNIEATLALLCVRTQCDQGSFGEPARVCTCAVRDIQ